MRRLALAFALAGCQVPIEGDPWAPDAPWPEPAVPEHPGNVIVVLVDDFGVDALQMYGVNPEASETPTLEALAEQGVMFANAYASPVCSNTRAGLLTGRLPVQHGFGAANGMPPTPGTRLRYAEVLLPEALDEGTGGLYDHAMVGKWHMHDQTIPEYDEVVTAHGFNNYRGHPDNLGKRILEDGYWESQVHYWKWEDGAAHLQWGEYVTSDEVDDTLYYTETLTEPWLVFLAPHATHDPWGPPPPELNPDGVDWSDDLPTRFKATVRALDIELGRLLAEMDPEVLARTTIIVIGDNGTQANAVNGPGVGRPAKGTVHEGGTHVPMIVAGAAVSDPGRVVDDLVTHLDVFATVLDLAEATVEPPATSVSFAGVLASADAAPARAVAYQERFEPSFAVRAARSSWMRSARDARYKLLRYDSFEFLIDLEADPLETTDLLTGTLDADEEAAHQALLAEFARVDALDLAEWVDVN